MDFTPQSQIELFHLLFLAHLRNRVDPSLYVLKGGCNLRFFFKSVRYSEDIDLDVHTVVKDTLKSQVSKLLASDSFARVLRSRQLEIIDVTAPKQTDTTQRWKLRISGAGSALPIHTKIEFSRRSGIEKAVYEQVDPHLTQNYELYPVLCNHYGRESVILQKVAALIHRAETQARDVFDLDHLLRAPVSIAAPKTLAAELDHGVENALSLSYSTYKSQVVAFISPEFQEHLGTESAWNQIQERVVNALSAFKMRRAQ